MKLVSFQEQVFFSTVRISLPKSGLGESIGTGFLFRARVDAQTELLLLISNKHVFGQPDAEIVLNFHRIGPDGLPDLGKTIEFRTQSFKEIYYAHPDPGVDLACLNVSFIGAPGEKAYYRNVFPEMLATFGEDDLLAGNDVWFVGYPENRFDVAHNLPLLRRGYISSIPRVDFNNQRLFVVDAQVFPGSSGSPVFTGIGDKFRLIGVVAATMVKGERLQILSENAPNLGIQQMIGLGLVIKATAVGELVEQAVKEWVRSNR